MECEFWLNGGGCTKSRIRQIEATKPTISKVQVHLFTQTPFRPNAEAIPHRRRADQQFRIDRRPPCVGINGRKMVAYARQINKPTSRAQNVTSRHMILNRELINNAPCTSCFDPNTAISSQSVRKADQRQSLKSRKVFNKISPYCRFSVVRRKSAFGKCKNIALSLRIIRNIARFAPLRKPIGRPMSVCKSYSGRIHTALQKTTGAGLLLTVIAGRVIPLS